MYPGNNVASNQCEVLHFEKEIPWRKRNTMAPEVYRVVIAFGNLTLKELMGHYVTVVDIGESDRNIVFGFGHTDIGKMP